MTRKKHSLLTRILSIILIISTPLAQAQSAWPSDTNLVMEFDKLPNASKPVWEYMADKLYGDDGLIPDSAEKEDLTRLFFADYLSYINSIGLELASYEISVEGIKEIREQGECSQDTLTSYNKLLSNSVESDLETFTSNYCNNPCRQKAEFDFKLIANYAQPDGLPQTCADRAKEMYDSYNCKGLTTPETNDKILHPSDGTMLPLRFPDIKRPSMPIGNAELKMLPEFNSSSIRFMTADLPVFSDGAIGNKIDFSHILGSASAARIDPNLLAKEASDRIKISSRLDLSSSKRVDGDFKALLSKKKTVCTRERSNSLRKTFAEPGSTSTSFGITTNVRDPMDPRWTSKSPDKPETSKNEKIRSQSKNPACKSSGPAAAAHSAKLRAAYNEISYRKILEVLQHWPLYDDDNKMDKEALRLITGPADQFFDQLLSDIELTNIRACGADAESMSSDMSGGGTTINGAHYTVTIHEGDDTQKKPEEHPKPEPVSVASYFSSNSSATDAFINGLTLGSESTGAGTLTETRAGEIAAGVRDGSIPPEELDSEAAKGPLGKNAEEIEKLTRTYLAQGDYQGIKIFAAEIFGGVVGGNIVGATAKGATTLGAKLTMSLTSGKISSLFGGMQKIIMRLSTSGLSTRLVNSAKEIGWHVDDIKRLVKGATDVERHGPLSLGRLNEIPMGNGTMADTFRSSSYFSYKNTETISLYRAQGKAFEEGDKLGRFWTRDKPTGPVQSIIDSAIDPTWGNTGTHWIRIDVPPGTILHEGVAAAQRGLVGGGNQIVIEQIPSGWFKGQGAF